MKRPDRQDSDLQDIGQGYALLSLGITFALTLAGAALLGLWIDRRLGTLPLFTVVGSLMGMALGGFWLYHRVAAIGNEDDGDTD